MQSLKDAAKESSMRGWSTQGRNRLVKVFSAWAEEEMQGFARAAGSPGAPGEMKTRGYFTQEKYLYGLTAPDIERVLGLRPFELKGTANVYALARLPKLHEFDLRFSAEFPGGEVFGSKQQKQMMDAREDYKEGKNGRNRTYNDIVDVYLPGSSQVPQWELLELVPVAGVVGVATATVPFTRGNGSTERYSPHKRGPIDLRMRPRFGQS